jgi:hypothetical protein
VSPQRIAAIVLALIAADVAAAAPDNGAVRTRADALEVWSEAKQSWLAPEAFFDLEVAKLHGPTYGRTHDYPDYDRVKPWETLIDVLPDGRTCPMVFFHERWRRLPDVLAFDDRLRNYGGCRDVFDY